MKNKLFKLVVIAVMILVLPFAFLYAEGTKEKKVSKVNLVFRQSDTPSEVVGLKKAIDYFNQQNPNIHVDFQTVPWSDARDQLLRETAAKTGPDVMQLAFVWVKDLGAAGALKDLDPMIKANPFPNGIHDFIALNLAYSNGKIYGIPWTTDTFCLVYNENILKEAGISHPPNTWEELYKDSKIIKEKTGKFGFAFPAGSSSGGTMWFLANYYWWSNGLNLVEKNSSGKYVIGLKVKDVVEAMKYFDSFLKEGLAPQSMLGVSSWADPAVMSNLLSENQAIGVMPPATLRAILKKKPDLSLISYEIPKGRVTRTSHLGGRMLGINAYTKHPKESWKLLKFLTSAKVFKEFYTSQLPAQKTLLKTINFGKAFQGYARMLTLARTWGDYASSPAPIGAMWDATNREFGAAFAGQKSYEQAAKDLLNTVNNLLKGK